MDNMNEKYEVSFELNHETALVRILEGKYTDFIYRYREVSVGEIEEDETVNLFYTYDVEEIPESYTADFTEEEKKQFEHLIGDILCDIIVNSDQVKIKEASGNNNIK